VDFYIYFLRRSDKEDPLELNKGQPFYVGKGSNDRIGSHRKDAKMYQNGNLDYKCLKNSIIVSLWNSSLDFEEEVIFNHLTEQEAFKYEIQIIAIYGRIDLGTGCLANMTDGGEGHSGCIRSEETRRKISNAGIGRVFSQESKQKISQALKGKAFRRNVSCSEEHKMKISAARKGIQFSDEHKKKLSEAHKGKCYSAETKRKMSLSQKGKTRPYNKRGPTSEETKKKISEANKNRILGPLSEEVKAKISAALKGRRISQETRNKIRNAKLGFIFTEETKAKMSQSHKGKTFNHSEETK